MFAHNTEEVIESDEYGEADFDAEVIHLEVDNLFTLKTSTLNIWSEQSVCTSLNKNPATQICSDSDKCRLYYLDY